MALNNATLRHAVALADKGYLQAMKDDAHLKNGLKSGQLEAVKNSLEPPGLRFVQLTEIGWTFVRMGHLTRPF